MKGENRKEEEQEEEEEDNEVRGATITTAMKRPFCHLLSLEVIIW